MAEPTYLLLAVNSERAADLRAALEKREYIRIVELDRDTRKKLEGCPACGRKFNRETTYTITEELIESLGIMLAGMRHAKSVVIINKKNHLKDVILAERPRAVEVPPAILKRAIFLELVEQYIDGEQDTYFVTAKGLSLLDGGTVTPSTVVVVNDQIIDTSGSMKIEQVRFRNIVRHEILIKSLKRLIRELPSEVRDFVVGNQMPLI
jgi:SOS-response transcriptional repressor LexA